MDLVSPEVRSRTMRAIRSKDTKPELAVRHQTHAMGYRYRLHRQDLPGRPDMVFPGSDLSLNISTVPWSLVRRS